MYLSDNYNILLFTYKNIIKLLKLIILLSKRFANLRQKLVTLIYLNLMFDFKSFSVDCRRAWNQSS